MATSSQPKRVGIIGAGMSGMSAALQLRDRGDEPIILEAQNRAGGRVQTLRAPFRDGLYGEAGATYIPGSHALTRAYLDRYGIKLHTIDEERLFTQWTIAGERVRVGGDEAWPVILTPSEREGGLAGMVERYIAPALARLGDITAPDWPANLADLDDLSYHDFLVQAGASPGAIALIRRIFPDIHGAGIEDSSALFCLRDFTNEGAGWSLIEGGSDTLPQAMATDLGQIIRFGARVDRIERSPDGVKIIYEQGGQIKRLECDALVIALQFSCLRAIEIHPAFPTDKSNAISSLGHSDVTRVFLQTDERYWGDDGPEYMGITDTPVLGIRDCSYHLPGRRGLIECYIPGAAATRAAELDESDRSALAVNYVQAVYPGMTDHVEASASKCWGSDPWARGGYAYFRPGEMRRLIPIIKRPEGVVHFAGDHASPWPAWMQGALHAGHRVADEIGDDQ